MRLLFLIGLLLLSTEMYAQKVVNIRHPSAIQSIEVNAGLSIPSIPAGYTIWLPAKSPPRGLIVVQEARRDSVVQNSLIKTALKAKLAVLYISTNNPIEFYFTDKSIKVVADDIVRICSNFQIPENEILYIGNELAGTRALKLAIFCEQNKEYRTIKPKAIALSNSPIDIHRYFNYSKGWQSISLHEGSGEVKFSVREYLKKNLDGTPLNNKARYTSYSPYSNYVLNGGNAAYFTKIYIRAYISQDINYQNAILGGNSYDVYNFAKQVERLGSNRSEIVFMSSTSSKQTNSDLDEKEVIHWFVNLGRL